MKNLLLIPAFILTSFFGTVDESLKSNTEDFVCGNWATVTASCGSVYYLCMDNYTSDRQLREDIMLFDAAKCVD